MWVMLLNEGSLLEDDHFTIPFSVLNPFSFLYATFLLAVSCFYLVCTCLKVGLASNAVPYFRFFPLIVIQTQQPLGYRFKMQINEVSWRSMRLAPSTNDTQFLLYKLLSLKIYSLAFAWEKKYRSYILDFLNTCYYGNMKLPLA